MKDPFPKITRRKTEYTGVHSLKTGDEAVPTFEVKGGHQGGHQQIWVGTEDKLLGNNNLDKSVKWVTVSEGGHRLGLKKRVLKKHCKSGHFVTRKVEMNGGWGYEISLESIFKYYESIGDWGKCSKIIQLMRPEIKDQDVKEKEKEKDNYLDDRAYAKFQICKIIDEINRTSKKKRQ